MKNNKAIGTKSINTWKKYQVQNQAYANMPLSIDIIEDLINKFYEQVVKTLPNDTILLQIRMDLGQGITRSLTQYSKININDLDK